MRHGTAVMPTEAGIHGSKITALLQILAVGSRFRGNGSVQLAKTSWRGTDEGGCAAQIALVPGSGIWRNFEALQNGKIFHRTTG